MLNLITHIFPKTNNDFLQLRYFTLLLYNNGRLQSQAVPGIFSPRAIPQRSFEEAQQRLRRRRIANRSRFSARTSNLASSEERREGSLRRSRRRRLRFGRIWTACSVSPAYPWAKWSSVSRCVRLQTETTMCEVDTNKHGWAAEPTTCGWGRNNHARGDRTTMCGGGNNHVWESFHRERKA